MTDSTDTPQRVPTKGIGCLSIGCGLGTDTTNFARAGADYTGVEFSSASLELTKSIRAGNANYADEVPTR